MKSRHLLRITWEDTNSRSAWHSEEETSALKCSRCLSVGWKCPSDKNYLRIAATQDEFGKLADITTIPRRNVIEVRRLIEPKRRK